MFCKNCGKEIADSSTFCGYCGTATTPAEPAAPVQEPVQYAAPVAPADDAGFAQFGAAPAVAKKAFNKKHLLLAGIALVLVAAIVIGAIFIFGGKKKGADADELNQEVGKAFNVLSSNKASTADKGKALTSLYGALTSGDGGAEFGFKLNISDEMIAMIQPMLTESLGQNLDLSFIKDTAIKASVNSKDGLIGVDAALTIGSDNLLDVDVIVDSANGVMYVGSPSLSDTYMKLDLSELSDMMGGMELSTSSLSMLSTYTELLPSEDELNKLIDNYAGIVDEVLTPDTNASTNLTVNGISQQVTEYTINVTDADVLELAKKVLTEAKTDSTITGFIKDAVDLVAAEAGEGGMMMDSSAIITQYEAAIDELLAELSSETATGETLFTLVRYVDAEDTIVGRKLTVQGKEIFYHATATSGSAYASTFEVKEADFLLSGAGTIADGKKTGVYSFAAEGMAIEFKLKDFIISDAGINGSIIIYPPMDEIMGDNDMISSLLKGAKPGIEIKLSNTGDSSGIEFNLVAGEQVLIGYVFTMQATSSSSLSVPSNVVSDPEMWATTIDQEAFMKKLEDSPLGPLVSTYTQGMSAMGGLSSDAIYGYDSDALEEYAEEAVDALDSFGY